MRRAAAREWRTHLVCCRPPEDLSWLTPLERVGTTIEYLPRARRNFDLGCVRRVYWLCRKLRADILHCDNTHTSPLLGAALAGVPVRIWQKRSMEPAFEAGRPRSLREQLAVSVRCTFALATRVLPVSDAVAEDLASLGLTGSKVAVLSNPCDGPDRSKYDRSRARSNLGAGSDQLIVMTVGHAVPVKGWDVLIRAFAYASRDLPQARLVLVGSFTAEDEQTTYCKLAALVDQLGVRTRVRFIGSVLDVYELLVAADIFVLPSRSEGDSNALLQALSSGLPCLATRVGRANDLIAPTACGLLVDRADPDDMAAALRRLLLDGNLRARLSARAKTLKHSLTSCEYAQGLVRVYADLLVEHGYSKGLMFEGSPVCHE